MHTSQNAPPGASGGRTPVIRARTRETLESEFLALYRLRREIDDSLRQMARTIDRLEARNAGGARG